MDFLQIFLELFFGFIALFLLTKLLGKTQINQITPFDFISALILGELVGNALYDKETHIGQMLFSIVLWTSLIYLMEIITQKKKRFRKFLEGEPSIVIRKGKIDYQVLKKNNLDINQLQHLLRSKGVFSIQECEYAILETNGTVSVLKKAPYDYVTVKDLNLTPNPIYLPVTLISDGEVEIDNLRMIQWDMKKLMKEISKHGVKSPKDVLYAEWREGEPLLVQTYDYTLGRNK